MTLDLKFCTWMGLHCNYCVETAMYFNDFSLIFFGPEYNLLTKLFAYEITLKFVTCDMTSILLLGGLQES